MNKFFTCLVLTSLLTAVVWSPSSSAPVVVVEYDKETTKVVISPQNVDEKPAKETAFSGPRDLAYGKCKHKIANAFGKTKDAVSETVHTVSGTCLEMEEHAKEAVAELIENRPLHPADGKDTFSGRLLEKIPGHTAGEFFRKVRDGVVKGVIGEVKKVGGNVIAIVKDVALKQFDIIDSPKRMGEDISRNVTGEVKESAEHVEYQAKETVKNVREVLGQGRFNKLKSAYGVIRGILYRFKIGSVSGLVSALFHKLGIGSIAGLVHMLGFSTAYGMCVWVTFVSSYILARHLSRPVLGVVQSRIYPVYFRAMAYSVSASLLGHLASQKSETLASSIGLLQSSSLLCALLMVLTNMILLEPKATKAMHKRMKLEKEEGRGLGDAKDGMVDGCGATMVRSANGRGVRVSVWERDGGRAVKRVAMERQDLLRLNEKLKRLNAYSSALNLFTLVALTWHMAYMGQQLQAIHGT